MKTYLYRSFKGRHLRPDKEIQFYFEIESELLHLGGTYTLIVGGSKDMIALYDIRLMKG